MNSKVEEAKTEVFGNLYLSICGEKSVIRVCMDGSNHCELVKNVFENESISMRAIQCG